MKQILFVNGSPNRNGNTVEMAHRLLSGKGYETLHLVDYKIHPLGHSMTGLFRTLFDRIYESSYKHQLSGKDLYFIFQGAAPSSAMLEAGSYTMGIFCRLFGLSYKGMATDLREAERLGTNLLK